MSPSLDALVKSTRFEIQRELGSGGMGVVYHAWDNELGADVALKALLKGGRREHVRLKREFRALCDIHHPNLVRLYEFLELEGLPLIVMELVPGRDLLSFVTGREESEVTTSPRAGLDFGEEPTLPEGGGEKVSVDTERLVDAFLQLCDGLEALHRRGKVHRDVKPSNVLVEDGTGRVVLLDFGLVRERTVDGASSGLSTTENELVGTIPYMAPELVHHASVGAAADWYAVGVLLYESLTGRYPHEGSPWQVLLAKQKERPRDPREFNPACPPELAELAMALLSPVPGQRPDGRAIRQVLNRLWRKTCRVVPEASLLASGEASPAESPEVFVGRGQELDFLSETWRRAQRGCPAAVCVEGESGVGKTALLRHFLADVVRARRREGPLVIYSRCHERESVPYKAFRGLVDRMGSFLAHVGEVERERLLPQGYEAVCQLFPTLAMPGIPVCGLDLEPAQVRGVAFKAFASLLVRVARLRGLVAVLDDIQWADEESVELMLALWERLSDEEDCACLLLLGYRTGVENEALDQALSSDLGRRFVEHLELRVLGEESVRQLVAALAGPAAESRPEWETCVRSIHRESGGNPLLVAEMVRYLRDSSQGWSSHLAESFHLRDALQERLGRLSPVARQALVAASVAGRAVAHDVLARACGQDWRSESWRSALHELASERLVQRVGFKKGDLVEPYHDRIREEVAGSLSEEERRAVHEALAAAFEGTGGAYTEAAAAHWEEVGQQDKAKELYLAAARMAARNLAFWRAARLFEQVMRLEDSDEAMGAVALEWAASLASIGLSERAGRVCEEVLDRPIGEEARLKATFLAADQLLKAGYVAEGLRRAREVLGWMEEKIPKSGWRLAAAVLWRRALLRFRGFEYEARDSEEATQERAKLDMLWSLSLGLSMVDPVLAGYFHARFFRRALDVGEDEYVARGLLLEGAFRAARGIRFLNEANEVLVRADAIARRLGLPKLRAQVALAEGIARFFGGEWGRVEDELRWALETFRTKCYGVGWEMATAVSYLGFTLRRTGRFLEAMRLEEELESDEVLGSNRFLAANLRTMSAILWLARGQADEIREHLDRVLETWPEDRFTIQHFYRMYGRCEVALYDGQPEVAQQELDANFGLVRRAAQFRFFTMRTEYARLKARTALAMAARESSKARRRHLSVASKAARALSREGVPFTIAWARHIEAAVAHLSGLPTQTVSELFETAASSLEASGLKMHMLAARARAAQVSGNESARQEALGAMRQEGVSDPERLLRVLSPGFEK